MKAGRGEVRRGLSFPRPPRFPPTALPFIAHVVAHTHWDREWYQPLARFRQRLVALVDELLDDPPSSDESFLLDGQAILLDDYLSVRPERAAELSSLLQHGRLEAGPWYVLADELIPSGEALVRNLLAGRRALRALRAHAPPVLYCPDSFGHPAALPTIASGFDIPVIIVWRGFGGRRWPAGDTFTWRAADGTSALLFHLPRDGYEYGSHLPIEPNAARDRWRRIRTELGQPSRTGVLLVANGADHHARQLHQREAVAALASAAVEDGDRARGSSLRSFVEDLAFRVRSLRLPQVAGELRDSYGYTWTLASTLATRAAQKRRNATAERMLIRDAEPWAALSRQARASVSRRPLVVAAWKTLLEAQPHDTLCGCSIDAVALAADRRFEDAIVQAVGVREDAVSDLIGYEPAASREARDQWHPVLVVRNATASPRGGVALVDVRRWKEDVPVGPGSAPRPDQSDDNAVARTSGRISGRLARDRLPSVVAGARTQQLSRYSAYDRVESPRHYPSNARVSAARAAMWIDNVPGYGIKTLSLRETGRRAPAVVNPVRATDTTLDNGLVRLGIEEGNLSIEDVASGRRITALFAVEDLVDAGDLYTPSLRGAAASASVEAPTITHRGPLVGEARLAWRLIELRSEDDDQSASAPPVTAARIVARVSLHANSPIVRVHVTGHNSANDHRLRLALRTDVRDGAVWADAAFGPVHRRPIELHPEDRQMESAPPTAPLQRYVSLFSGAIGATLLSDGLAEYEATAEGEIFVTLVRAVGELSRNDLPERPGHAGWPVPTPLAQSHGPFEARFGLLLHGGRAPETIAQIERASDEVLLPLVGGTLRSALSLSAPVNGVELRGDGLAFSTLKDAEDGDWLVARCVNLLEREVEGSWNFGFTVAEARASRLDETPLAPIPVDGHRVAFRAKGRQVVTLLVRSVVLTRAL
jgi:mannosylglycerate hydrolase